MDKRYIIVVIRGMSEIIFITTKITTFFSIFVTFKSENLTDESDKFQSSTVRWEQRRPRLEDKL